MEKLIIHMKIGLKVVESNSFPNRKEYNDDKSHFSTHVFTATLKQNTPIDLQYNLRLTRIFSHL